ncbi:hypothetical protein D6850_03230 [Roseovarius spongiae]|uniref:Peptidase M48 Ste24p n=1 Tax=Roseovarius spongiae TaxID=2320272 RepID=A0A3A8AXK1_9RHOB|nr:hypothetical protein [Roseovarius spongiae]RKF16577.1 hypothetical protein D6850_03230 [Roseovarius spongiae]
MTALREYDRLEAPGLWRASPDAQRTDVIVSIGDATLTISDMRDRPLAHWSIPALSRANPGQRPAIYHPDGDPGETLELGTDEDDMIAALERLRSAVARRRPRPGRLRLLMMLGSILVVAALAAFWLPGAVREHAVSVVPGVKRAEIGRALEQEMQAVTGPPCHAPGGIGALAKLSARLPSGTGGDRLVVVRSGVTGAIGLPGGTILLGRALIEDHEEPDVVAGYIIAARMRMRAHDPLGRLLSHAGLVAAFRLLTTGHPGEEALRAYAQALLTSPPPPVSDELLLDGFRNWRVRATPYAYARDVSGETVLPLIEADPFRDEAPEPVLSDGDWLRLQGICGG